MDWDSLKQLADRAIAAGRIGPPVAARWFLHAAPDAATAELLAADAVAAAARWFQDRPATLAALGDLRAGRLAVLARYAGGQSLIVSAGPAPPGGGVADLVIVGRRGVAAWEEDGPARIGLSGAAPAEAAPWRAWLRRSLETGRAVDAGGGRPGAEQPWNLAYPGAPPPAPAVSPPYGVLLVAGDHSHQSMYARALAADPRCRLVGVADEADVAPERRRWNAAFAQRLGLPLLPDLEAALARPDVQVVSLCAEPRRRGRLAVRAAQRGKHLYLDKPLAGSAEDARAAAEAIRRAGVAGHMFTFARGRFALRVRRKWADGRLQPPGALHLDCFFAKGRAGTARRAGPRREAERPERWETVRAKRELTNVGVYPLVLALLLTGRRPRRVFCVTGNYFFAEHEDEDMEDFGQLLCELDGGWILTVSAGRTGWRSHPAGGLQRVAAACGAGALRADAHRPRLAAWADAPAWTPPPADPDDPMGMWETPPDSPYAAPPKLDWITEPDPLLEADARHFLDCLEGGRPVDVSADLAAAATAILAAGYRSAAQSSLVSFV